MCFLIIFVVLNALFSDILLYQFQIIGEMFACGFSFYWITLDLFGVYA